MTATVLHLPLETRALGMARHVARRPDARALELADAAMILHAHGTAADDALANEALGRIRTLSRARRLADRRAPAPHHRMPDIPSASPAGLAVPPAGATPILDLMDRVTSVLAFVPVTFTSGFILAALLH